MQQDLKHGNGLAFSIFGGQSFTDKDKQAILNFSLDLKKDIPIQTAWARNMSNCSIAAQNQTRVCLKTKGSLTELANGLKISSVASKAASFGLKALSIAGNMIAMWGITEAISDTINPIEAKKLVDDYVNAIAKAMYGESVTKEQIDATSSPVKKTSPISFTKSWRKLGRESDEDIAKEHEEAKAKLLELAEAGELTTEAFEESSVAQSILSETGLLAQEAAQEINGLAENVKQLDAMRTGISSITSAYDEKKDSKQHIVSSSTLDSMYDTFWIAVYFVYTGHKSIPNIKSREISNQSS